MPSYDLLAKGGTVAILAIILVFLLKSYIDSSNKEKDGYHQLVNDVRTESKEREDKLMKELDRYNDSLQQISENIKVIPAMQADISYLKQKVR